MNKILILTILALCSLTSFAQSDPTLTGMIIMYTDKAEKQLKSQQKAMALQTSGHIWLKEEYEDVTNFQRQFNDYLDSFNSVLAYAAQIFGFYHEIGKLSENMGKLTKQISRSPSNMMAVALTPRRNAIYRDLILNSVEIVNDIRLACMSDSKMTEKQRIEIVFGIRPKLKTFNRKLQHLALAVKYTSLSDVWREIDIRARSYDVDKNKISDEAFRRWRGNGQRIRPGSGNEAGTIIIDPLWPLYPFWSDSLHVRDSIIINNPTIAIQ